MENILEQIRNVEGLINDKEAETLYNIARNLGGGGAIVEIGSWKGKSTICLAKGAKTKKNIKVFAIDPHNLTLSIDGKELPTWSREDYEIKLKDSKAISSFDDFKTNIRKAGVDDVVKPLIKTSEEAINLIDEPIEFIFIDGDHSYESVKKDFDMWFPKLINNGIMAFHDTIWGGPRKLMIEKIYKSNNFRNINFANSITYAQKVTQNSLTDRIKNKHALLKSTLYSLVYTISFHSAKYFPKSIKAKLKKIFLSLH